MAFTILKEQARALRKTMTDAEKRIWYFLRNKQLQGYRFIREHPIDPYIVDFVCRQKKLIVELDGGQHADAAKYDEKRTQFLKMKGYTVLRFWNNDIFEHIEGVLETILAALEKSIVPPPNLPPSQKPVMGGGIKRGRPRSRKNNTEPSALPANTKIKTCISPNSLTSSPSLPCPLQPNR